MSSPRSYRPAIDRARELRHAATLPERRLWGFLRGLRSEGCHFRRQAPLCGYVLDFVCYRNRLVIEIDGAHHGSEAQLAHDITRDAVLARENFRTLRLLASDVLGNLEGVCILIRENLPTPHPGPPHKGEGEAPLLPPPCGEGRGGGSRQARREGKATTP